jgi:hypothetical protein
MQRAQFLEAVEPLVGAAVLEPAVLLDDPVGLADPRVSLFLSGVRGHVAALGSGAAEEDNERSHERDSHWASTLYSR